MLDPEILKSFATGITALDLTCNSAAKRLLEDAITDDVTDTIPEDSRFDFLTINWEKDGFYIVTGRLKDGSGGVLLQFKENMTEVGFRTTNKLRYFTPLENVKTLMKACVSNIKGKARVLEAEICEHYIDSAPEGVRYGTEEYLENEFKEHVKKVCDEMSRGHKNHITEAFPLNFNLKGDILQYFIDHEVESSDKIHVLPNKAG